MRDVFILAQHYSIMKCPQDQMRVMLVTFGLMAVSTILTCNKLFILSRYNNVLKCLSSYFFYNDYYLSH